MGTPEQRAEAYGKAVQNAMLELQRVHLLPLMKESFLCSAACVDRASDNDLQTCLMRCQRRPEAAKHLIESRMQDFQARMQRCVQRCQDEVQETLPTQPSDREIAKAQESLAKSMAECADTYRMKQLPKLKQDLAAELPAVLQQVQQSQ